MRYTVYARDDLIGICQPKPGQHPDNSLLVQASSMGGLDVLVNSGNSQPTECATCKSSFWAHVSPSTGPN